MLELSYSSKFTKDLLLCTKRGKCIKKLREIILLLSQNKLLPEKCCNHKLKGNFSGFYECHIENDLLLIYKICDGKLRLERLGTHSDLF